MPSAKTRPGSPRGGWPPWGRPTGCTCWTPAPPTARRSACGRWAPWWRWRRSSPGGLTRPATAPWPWCRRTRTSAYAPIWTRCSAPAGGRRWRAPGGRTPSRRPTATPGASAPTGGRTRCSGVKRSTPGRAGGGCTRFTRCWSGCPAFRRAGRRRRRGCSWITTPTRPNPGGSICPCWSCRWKKLPETTGIPTTWAGNIYTTAGGTTASAP